MCTYFFRPRGPYLQNRKVKREEVYVHSCFLQVYDGLSQERGAWCGRKLWVDQWVELKIRSFQYKVRAYFLFQQRLNDFWGVLKSWCLDCELGLDGL